MPENDQTRWIGIRPTNPAETIPVSIAAWPLCHRVEPCAANTPFNVITKKLAPAVSDLQAIQTIVIETNGVLSVAGTTYVPIYTVPAGKIFCMERVVAYPVMVQNSGVMVYIKIGAVYYWLDGAVASVIKDYQFFPLTQKVDEDQIIGLRFITSVAGTTFNGWVYGYLINKYT